MARANAAYYATHDPFADFTTSPEISQVFGEILGLWAAVSWQLLGSPDPVLLVEAGPGRGTLMADALRAVSKVAPAFRAALRLHLVETSPRLRAEQARRLPDATWHDALDDVPRGPMLLLANEFLDALPIRQFIRRAGGWAERFVGPEGGVEQRHRGRPGGLGLGPRPGERRRGHGAGTLRTGPRLRRRRWRSASPPIRAPRCCWTTARSTARRATACRPWPVASRPTRSARPAPPTSPRMSISPPWPGRPAATAPAPRARCRKACSSPGSACSSAPTGWHGASRRPVPRR